MLKIYNKNFNFLDFIIVFFSVALKYLKSTFGISDIYMGIYFLFLCILVLVKFVKLRHNKKNLWNLFVILLYCLIITYSTAAVDFAMSLILVLVFYKKGYQQYLYYLLISSIICFSLTTILGQIGIIESEILTRKVEGEILERNSLGFQTVNGAFLHWYIIILLYFYLFGFNKLSYIILGGISYYLYLCTNTRTGFYCVIAFMILAPIFNLGTGKLFFKTSKYWFIIFTIVSIGLALVFGKANNEINEIVSNRFVLWNYSLKNYPISSILTNHNLDTYPLDNLYINFLQHYGLIAYTGLCLLYFFCTSRIKDKKMLITLFFFLIYCMFESNNYYYINYSFFILMYVLIAQPTERRYNKND